MAHEATPAQARARPSDCKSRKYAGRITSNRKEKGRIFSLSIVKICFVGCAHAGCLRTRVILPIPLAYFRDLQPTSFKDIVVFLGISSTRPAPLTPRR